MQKHFNITGNKNIIYKLKSGDKKSFEIVYWAYRAPIYGLALKYLKDAELAEDAVQDIFLKLWDKRGNLNDERSLQGFLFISLKNHVLNMIKVNKRRIARQFDYLEIDELSIKSPEEIQYHTELESLLHTGLSHLPKRKQEVYRLKKLEGYTNQEIAERLGITINTVKSQYVKANDLLRNFVESHLQSRID